MEERYELCKLKIYGITKDEEIPVYGAFFKKVSRFLVRIFTMYDKRVLDPLVYEDVVGDNYLSSFANPAYAVSVYGDKIGRLLSFVYAELFTLPGYACEGVLYEMLIRLEFFIEVFCLCECYTGIYDEERGSESGIDDLCKGLYNACYSFFYDYLDSEMERRVGEKVDPSFDFAYRIITESDLDNTDYLYKYGEYISENEIKTSEYLAGMDEKTIELMADTYTEGYRTGFEKTGKDISKKSVVNIVYPIGFERVVKRAIFNFEAMGLRPTLTRNSFSVFHKRGTNANGYYSSPVNRQFIYDHREDEALFLDRRYVKRKLSALEKAYKKYEAVSKEHGGPAWIEVFGNKEFIPEKKKECCFYSRKQEELVNQYSMSASLIINHFIPGEERSFTIIAYPIPEIGSDYEAVMKETIDLNTLPSQKWEKIQQSIIDVLDECEYVRVEGTNGNKTDMTVNLCKLNSPADETKFENCTADVNIPVGEVFTSPVLKGTDGILHVSGVYLNGLYFKDLTVSFRDGMIDDYDCTNYVNQKENKSYIKENILKHHESLPIGEFAIGTNTTAYVMAKRFGIEGCLPILIAEKTGPHFAVGDTCYSHEEDVKVYNPDGKEIVARDNEISILRKDKERAYEAYFNCHTDITIPYDELGRLYGVRKDGGEVDIISEGRFVLAGTEDLNLPF